MLVVAMARPLQGQEVFISNEARYHRALRDIQFNRYVHAWEELDQIRKLNEWQTRAYFLKGYLTLKWDRPEEALRYFSAYERSSAVPLLYVQWYKAQAYEQLGQYSEALSIYERLGGEAETSYLKIQALRSAAVLYERLGQRDRAQQTRLRLIGAYPLFQKIAEVKSELAISYEADGQYDPACQYYYDIMWNHPKSPVAGQARQALNRIRQSHQWNMPDLSVTELFEYAERLYDAKEFGKAEVQYQALMDKQSDHRLADDALLKMGLCAYYENRYSEAADRFRTLYSQYHDSHHAAQAVYWLGKIYLARRQDERFKSNVALLQNKYRSSPWAAKATYELGAFHENRHEYWSAITAYRTILAYHSSSSLVDDAAWKSGWIYYKKLKRPEKALQMWEYALKLQPQGDMSDRCSYWSGKLYEEMNLKPEAEKAYQAVWDNHPYSFYAMRLKERFGLDRPMTPLAIQRMDFPDAKTREVLQRCEELILLGLGSEAEAEILFLLSFDHQDDAKQQLKVMLAEVYFYAGRPYEALKLVNADFERMENQGRFARIPREIWRLNFPLGYWNEVQQFATTYGMDPFYVLAVIREESRFRPEAMSWAKAHGLMQIIPSTASAIAKSLSFSNFSLDKIFDPDINIQMGTYYLAQQKQRFSDNPYMALAAYNGGPGNVQRWYKQRQPKDIDEFIESIPFDETYHYVKKVMTSYWHYQLVYGATDPNQIVVEASYRSAEGTN